ncbi:MAG TPA: lipoprotein insertase outer membrane protein LolB [Mariprofundaceae bacterium]|nr:lipoprotein insertase outer membrane protein LolB [Mariprofundaceae bacterium]
MTAARLLRPLLPLLALAWLAGCAVQRPPAGMASSIGPYPSFSGRLIVIQPTRRWQVEVDWKAATPSDGWLRLTHAASGRIVELTWHGSDLRLSDNQDPAHPEKTISEAQLASYGIVLPPPELAAILLGRMPPQFRATGPGRWEAHRNGDVIRIDWNAAARRLTLTDLARGNRATLLIGAS